MCVCMCVFKLVSDKGVVLYHGRRAVVVMGWGVPGCYSVSLSVIFRTV